MPRPGLKSKQTDGLRVKDALYRLFKEDTMADALRIFELHELYHDNSLDEEGLKELGALIVEFVDKHETYSQREMRAKLGYADQTWASTLLWESLMKNQCRLKQREERAARAFLHKMILRFYFKERDKRALSSTAKEERERFLDAYAFHIDTNVDSHELNLRSTAPLHLDQLIELVRKHFIPRLGRRDVVDAANERLDQQLKRTREGLSAEQILELSEELDPKTRQTKINALNKNLERLRNKLWESYLEEKRARELGSVDTLPISDEELNLICKLFEAFRG